MQTHQARRIGRQLSSAFAGLHGAFRTPAWIAGLKGDKLPESIAAVMTCTIALFVLSVGFSISWTVRTLDREAAQQSVVKVQIAQNNLLARARMITLDYAKWDAAVYALKSGDLSWIFDNIGSTATIGRAVQLVVLGEAPVAGDIGWTDDGAAEGTEGLVDADALRQIHDRLTRLPADKGGATQFFIWSGDDLYASSASHFEPVDQAIAPPDSARDFGFLVMGIRVTDRALAEIGSSFSLRDLSIGSEVPDGRLGVPLLGLDGEAVAYLTWERPSPGGDAVQQLLPVLLLVLGLASGLALIGWILVQRNAAHLVETKRQASEAALTDALTRLPNRAAFNQVIARDARTGERAVVFLDVNQFKRINDSFGHAVGDQLIALVARRLARLGAPDCVLARISGDEFVFVLTGPFAERRTTSLVGEIAAAFAEPFSVAGRRLGLHAAVGYAVQRSDDLTGDDLVRQADLAMYEAKRLRSPTAVAFSAMRERDVIDAYRIECALRSALAGSGEFSVLYQPIVERGGRCVRAEALARWASPELGIVPPGRFIPVAEQAGLIVPLGRIIFDLICDDLEAHPDLRISVNVSPLQLVAPDFISDLLTRLERRAVDPSRIEIELTESVLITDTELAEDNLRRLHAAGFSTALDDFGTGYSSIGYLDRLSFETLKIDRTFIQGVRGSPQRRALLEGMIDLAHRMGLTVVGEGVESDDDHQLLCEVGCDLMQGYHLGRPLTVRALAAAFLTTAAEDASRARGRDRDALPTGPGASATSKSPTAAGAGPWE